MSHPLLDRLASTDPKARVDACRAAPEDPAATLLAPALGRALGDPDKAVARAASDALVTIGRSVGGVDAVLKEALAAPDSASRWGAAFTAARLEPPEPRLLPALVEAFSCDDGDIRWTAARILVDMSRLHGEVVPLLIGLARTDPQPGVRRMSIHTLRKLVGTHPGIDDALLGATDDEETPVRRAALTALAGIPEPSDALLARLTTILTHDADAASQRLAALALGELGERRGDLPDSAARALANAVGAVADGDLRRAAERARRRVGHTPCAEENL
ncbi:MAG: HEAT repeat domain-containing protein [Myxococcales bacterium]|nr:HEAT repeat domain-containing protein [Myxococcales bacterium]